MKLLGEERIRSFSDGMGSDRMGYMTAMVEDSASSECENSEAEKVVFWIRLWRILGFGKVDGQGWECVEF